MLITGTPLSSHPCVSLCRTLGGYHACSPSDRRLVPPPSTSRPSKRCLRLSRTPTLTSRASQNRASSRLKTQ